MVRVRTIEGRAMLRAAMRHWPHVSAETDAFLAALPWQVRRVAVLHHGEGKPLEYVASALGCAERTVQRYLRQAHWLYAHRK